MRLYYLFFGPLVLGRSLIPVIPNSVTWKDTSNYNLWEFALKHQKTTTTIHTLISPDYIKVMNLIPMDAPHPLYGDNVNLRTEYLLDYIIPDPPVIFENPWVGLLVMKNLNGKNVIFKKNKDGKIISVNDVEVLETKILNDGIVVFRIADVLFGHREMVQVQRPYYIDKMEPNHHSGRLKLAAAALYKQNCSF